MPVTIVYPCRLPTPQCPSPSKTEVDTAIGLMMNDRTAPGTHDVPFLLATLYKDWTGKNLVPLRDRNSYIREGIPTLSPATVLWALHQMSNRGWIEAVAPGKDAEMPIPGSDCNLDWRQEPDEAGPEAPPWERIIARITTEGWRAYSSGRLADVTAEANSPLSDSPAVSPEMTSLRDAAEKLRLKGNEAKILDKLIRNNGSVRLADLCTACDWGSKDSCWNSARVRLNKKLKKYRWRLSTLDAHAKAERIPDVSRNR